MDTSSSTAHLELHTERRAAAVPKQASAWLWVPCVSEGWRCPQRGSAISGTAWRARVRNHWGHWRCAPHLRGSCCRATTCSHRSPPHLSAEASLLLRNASSRFTNTLLPCPQPPGAAVGWARGHRPALPRSCSLHTLQSPRLPGTPVPGTSRLGERSCRRDSRGSASISTLSSKAAVLSAQGHVNERLSLFQSIFLHSPDASQGTQHKDFDDYSSLLLFCGINCPQDLTNYIFFPPTLKNLMESSRLRSC